MRIFSTRAHGIIDYVVGILLILAPFLLGFANGGIAQWLPIVLGAGTIVYSLMTRYELGAVKVIPMPLHLGLDIAAGALLAASPWLFSFANEVYWPHLIVGLLEIGVASTTDSGRAERSDMSSTAGRADAMPRPVSRASDGAGAARTDGAAARLRADIDSGRTGDKVDWPDPAAAPLGTDDEAAGASPSPRLVERTRAAETARPVSSQRSARE